MPSDSDSEDDDSTILALVLLIHPIPALSTTLVVSTISPKEHSTSARIKAIYTFEEKKSLV